MWSVRVWAVADALPYDHRAPRAPMGRDPRALKTGPATDIRFMQSLVRWASGERVPSLRPALSYEALALATRGVRSLLGEGSAPRKETAVMIAGSALLSSYSKPIGPD